MSNPTLVSQLLDSINNHLNTIHSSMDEEEDDSPDDDDDDLWVSGHRSIFSSCESPCQQILPTFSNNQYEGFHWDLDHEQNYHHLTFEDDLQQTTNLFEWSMNLNSDQTENDLDTSNSYSSTDTKITFSDLFHKSQSKQHPCYLYENFSDQSQCDSHSITKQYSIPVLQSPITFSQLKSPIGIDQCLQTSIFPSETTNPISVHPKSTDRLLNNPLPLSSTTRQSLPNLDFLLHYAKENPISFSTPIKPICKTMKNLLSLPKKPTKTIFYCRIPFSHQANTHQNMTMSPTEETETFSSDCSSTSSSGYCSNSSTNQTRLPLKSCLKRTKTNRRNVLIENQTRPSKKSSQVKKSVSFCDDITLTHVYRIPRESLTDSPPNEFNLSDNDDIELTNFNTTTPEHLTKPIPIKTGPDQYLIDVFANTILQILEIKCNDPKSYYLNNLINQELDRILRQDLCSLLREILEDGLRTHAGSLFSKKINLWRLIDLTTSTNHRINEAKIRAQIGLSSTVDWIEKFNSFIYQLLNFHELSSWLIDFLSHRKLLHTYYESWAFILVNNHNDLIENLTNQLEKLSPLPFRLKYTILSNSKMTVNNQRLTKKFNVRNWLRDRTNQMKISSTTKATSSMPPNVYLRRKFHHTIPNSK